MEPSAPSFEETTSLRAVIHFGAAAVSMLIAEKIDNKLVPLDYVERPIPLARDIFGKALIQRETLDLCNTALSEFQKLLLELRVPKNQIVAFSTNILQEAKNHEIFLNRMQLALGVCEVHPIDDGEMTRLIFLSSLKFLEPIRPVLGEYTFVVHIGPGNTRVLYFEGERIKGHNSYRLGVYRSQESLNGHAVDGISNFELFEENIHNVVEHLHNDYSGLPVDSLVVVGSEIQLAAAYLTPAVSGAHRLPIADITKLARELAQASPDQIVRRLRVNYTIASGLSTALQTCASIAESFGKTEVLAPSGDFHHLYMLDLLQDSTRQKSFLSEVIQSATAIADRYKCDKTHYTHVESLCKRLFRDLATIHNIDPKYEIILRLAAILHETGMFISAREHHKHSLYIILNTEIFGINTEERTLIALVARYHRRYRPDASHAHFRDLDREQRRIIYKLSAILRVADALDRTHTQRIKTIRLDTKNQTLYLRTTDIIDSTLEQLSIDQKGDLFQEIFGYQVQIATVQTR